MIIYFAIVAITNVLIGLILARYIWFPTNVFSVAALTPAGARTAHRAAAAPVARSFATQQNQQAVERPDTTPVEINKASAPDAEENHADRAKARAEYAKSWSDFAQQLREIKSRVNYCRSAPDMNLLRQAADQLKACALVWYEQLGKCISGEELDATTKALVDGMDLSAIEMFAAQCETSISNLEAFDYSVPAADVLAALEREIEMLDSQQKNVESSKKRKPVKAQ